MRPIRAGLILAFRVLFLGESIYSTQDLSRGGRKGRN